MKQLLHERLKEHQSGFAFEGMHIDSRDANALADEIEKYYIPRPRFEDGEPVQFGDDVEGCNGKIESILLFEDGSGTVYGEDDECLPKEPCGADIDEEGLSRPKTKVLDADGVEINVGDMVWHTVTGDKAIVADIHYETKYCVELDYVNGFSERYIPDYITHKEPDNQSKIDDDLTLPAPEYCKRYEIKVNANPGFDMSSYVIAMCKHLLERQRSIMERGA